MHTKQPRMKFRQFFEKYLESPKYHLIIVTLIVLDILFVFIELLLEHIYVCVCPSHPPEFVSILGEAFLIYTYIILGIFTLEMFAKLFIFGPRYFKDPWHCLDLIFILSSIVVNIIFSHIWKTGTLASESFSVDCFESFDLDMVLRKQASKNPRPKSTACINY